MQRLLAEAEAKAESRVSDLRNKIRSLEVERNDAEEEWAAKLGERVRELEKLRRVIMEKESDYAESQRMKRDNDKLVEEAEEAKRGAEREMKALKGEVEAAKMDMSAAVDAEVCYIYWALATRLTSARGEGRAGGCSAGFVQCASSARRRQDERHDPAQQQQDSARRITKSPIERAAPGEEPEPRRGLLVQYEHSQAGFHESRT